MRADLAHHYNGLNLNGLFTGEYTPDEVWDLLMHLPRDSATVAAIADDGDLAGEPGAPRPPRLTEFGPEVEVLASVHDLLASLLASVVTALGGKPPKIDPYPRPVSAAAARAQREHEEQQERLRRNALAQLLPHKYGKEVTTGGI